MKSLGVTATVVVMLLIGIAIWLEMTSFPGTVARLKPSAASTSEERTGRTDKTAPDRRNGARTKP